MNDRSNLAASIDGAPLADEEARDLWTRFSRYMDEHRGDMAGFARENGYASVTPTFERGQALLVVRTTEAPPEKPAQRLSGAKPAQRPGGAKPAQRPGGAKPAQRPGGEKPAPRRGGSSKPARGRRRR
ncbi:hypothetical protein WMF45_01730 [Sorangium sp. So ce448]|uniref:hypothetical protein n=1 Tax=Sorangium sp. So ce448 TaxID=3133314 RepID=UPI003F5E18B1